MRQWTDCFSSDLAKAVANADLVIESVPEDPSIKKRFL
jgi:3-hydroxybutyryl-CoA dehydrogenase